MYSILILNRIAFGLQKKSQSNCFFLYIFFPFPPSPFSVTHSFLQLFDWNVWIIQSESFKRIKRTKQNERFCSFSWRAPLISKSLVNQCPALIWVIKHYKGEHAIWSIVSVCRVRKALVLIRACLRDLTTHGLCTLGLITESHSSTPGVSGCDSAWGAELSLEW